jgi:hypothetical protein
MIDERAVAHMPRAAKSRDDIGLRSYNSPLVFGQQGSNLLFSLRIDIFLGYLSSKHKNNCFCPAPFQ